VLAKKEKFENILAKYPSKQGFTPVAINWDKVMEVKELKKPPTSEECWLAQEDIWIKQQLFRVIREALDYSARFKQVELKEGEPLPENAVGRYLFRSPNWELDLRIEEGEKKGQLVISPNSLIKNINAHKRTLPLREVYIYLQQELPNHQVTRLWFLIQGDPLPWNQAVKIGIKDLRIDEYGFTAKAPMQAEQWFTPSTSPIKQIEDIQIGYNSDRTDKVGEKLRPFKLEPVAPTDGTRRGGPSSGAPSGGMSGGGAGERGGSPAGGSNPGAVKLPGSGDDKGKTTNGFRRERYLQVTPQVRRLPIGIVLVVDQAYMQDVRTALSNSQLRIQVTQDQWHSGPVASQPSSAGLPVERGGGSRGEGNRGIGSQAPMGSGSGGGNRGFGSIPPGGGGSGARGGDALPGVKADSSADDSDPNLVELAIYGVVSFYDRPTGEAPKPDEQPNSDGLPKNGDKPKGGDKPREDDKAKDGARSKDGVTPKDSDKPKKDGDKPKDSDKPKQGEAPKDKPAKDASPKADPKKPGEAKDK